MVDDIEGFTVFLNGEADVIEFEHGGMRWVSLSGC
jgi:hypothetical protein